MPTRSKSAAWFRSRATAAPRTRPTTSTLVRFTGNSVPSPAIVGWHFDARHDPAAIAAITGRCRDVGLDGEIEREVVPAARAQGYLTKPQFLRLCEWKSPRARPHYQRNEPSAVERATGEALSTGDERR